MICSNKSNKLIHCNIEMNDNIYTTIISIKRQLPVLENETCSKCTFAFTHVLIKFKWQYENNYWQDSALFTV